VFENMWWVAWELCGQIGVTNTYKSYLINCGIIAT
jgi:hypothetical protein